MGYLHINNLYKDRNILNFKRCYALEKVHGTSAHIQWDKRSEGEPGDPRLTFYSGGEKHDRFVALFDQAALRAAFEALGHDFVTVYGEAYGGRQQGMSHTYGPDLKFIVFDVQVGDKWLNVPAMDAVARGLGLEVVPWEEVDTTLDTLNALRDRPSEVAVRRGMGADKQREGVVLRPLEEMTINNDRRVIAKHKIDKFGERATPQKVSASLSQERLDALAGAQEIADEWVVKERLMHVVAHLTVDGVEPGIESTGQVIAMMVEDVFREGAGEIVESKEAKQAISKKTAQMFKQYLQDSFKQ